MKQKIYTSTSFKILSTLQEVENKLLKPVSRKDFERLFSRLEEVQKECEDGELLSKIIYLYGKIVDKYVDTQVGRIAALAGKLKSDNADLKEKIAQIKLYGLSQENFSILSKIEKKLESSEKSEEVLSEEIGSVEELLTLAGFVYYQKKEETEKFYRTLPLSAKQSVGKHLNALKTSFFQNDVLTIQALFAAAYELAGRPIQSYPPIEEIKDFFSKREVIIKGDLPERSVFHKVN